MSSRCTWSPVGKIEISLFLSLPSVLVWLKMGHLRICKNHICFHKLIKKYIVALKWPILSQTSTGGSGKNKKILIFPTGLQVHIEDMFWVYKLFAEILSWAEQSSTQFFRRSNLLVVSSSCAALCFQLFDIWWSSLDIIIDF